MVTTIRAAVSIVMLLGFYLLAVAVVGGLGWLSYWLWREHAGTGAAKLTYVTLAVAVGVIIALWKVIRAKPEPPTGVPITSSQAPQLWQAVRELAAVAQTREPDEIVAIPDVNAAVTEDSKLLGLIGGTRRLYVGVPLLQALTVSQLRSVLAHELGHYSKRHTALGAITYRGRQAIQATVEQLEGRLGSWVFKLYARLYILVEAAVSRRQEIEADQASVRASGRMVAQAALRELPVIDAAWGFYFQRYIAPGWEAGYAPEDFFGGFGRMLAARGDELTRLRAQAPPNQKSRWDSHPPIAARIAAMDTMPDGPTTMDNRTASDLVPLFDRLCAAMAESAVKYEGRQIVSWDQLASLGYAAEGQRTADQVYRAAARLTGADRGSLATILDLSESGRLDELAEQLFPQSTGIQARTQFAEPMELLLGVAAVRSGAARWTHVWSGPPKLVRPDGSALDVAEIARLAVSPETVLVARVQIAQLGIDASEAGQVERMATAHGGEILGAMANVKVDGAPHDVLILDNGLLFVPCPKKTDHGKRRLVALVQSGPVTEIARRGWFLPYEEIAGATRAKEVPVRASLQLHAGRTVSLEEAWTGENLTRDSRDTLNAAIGRFLPNPALPSG